MKNYYVYILASNSKTLYTGVTNNLIRRVYQHKHKLFSGFTAKYEVDKLVYFEVGTNIKDAIAREKQIKGWSRMKKISLIETINPKWEDLSLEWDE
ncbi:MAG: GIY-YIG nuclease family protein [Ardenticatenaceae bacterium]|nr:GIY-YIG nuclease family protein [Ardenticatenaceae bacterium]